MTASTMVYQNRNEETREYLQQLSTYMRYMMRIRESRVKLGEELEHVENYVKMQEIRFPGSILLVTECPEKLNEIRVPHLLLHTIVENVFKHAMSLTETLMLMISCREIEENGFRGVQIIVEDNGKGFTSEQLEKYNGDTVSNEEKDTQIGLSNIKRSLKLWYGQENLFHISNAILNGAQVEIRIPEEGEKMDESIDC
ncbi:MAG: sensor histidine kinase [Lachnospiraceae bacterium]